MGCWKPGAGLWGEDRVRSNLGARNNEIVCHASFDMCAC